MSVKELPYHVELVVAREDLQRLFAAGAFILFLHDLGVVLKDVCQPCAGEDLAPEVVGLQAVRVGRIARAIVVALVERQEPGVLALKVRAEAHLLLVHSKVHQAAAELEEQLARVAVALVLLHRVVYGLLGEAVLEFEGRNGQAVDEQGEVEGKLGLVPAVAELLRDAEDIGGETLDRPGIAR